MRYIALILLIAAETALGAVSIDSLRAKLEANVARSGLSKKKIGVWVEYKGQKLYTLNGEKLFIPASVTKIIPAAAALEKLRSNYQFETSIYTNAMQDGEVLRGDAYLVGGGDPSFTSENMWNLVNEFTREGIRRIEGDIVVDDSRFDDVRFDPGRDESRGDRDKSYTAPVGGMSFNWNSVNVVVRPTEVGARAKVFINPENDYIEVLNETRTVRGGTNSIEVERLGIRYTAEGHPRDTIRVKGRLGTSVHETSQYRNITRPDFWSGAALKSFLKQRGIVVTGILRAGEKPREARRLAMTAGSTLSHVISDLMKFSNNYLAEMITKNLAYKNDHKKRATMNEGLEELRLFLDRYGWQRENYVLTSPSGLSRRNKFRPADVHALIEKLRKNLINFPEYLAAQAIGGVDGTLRKRMKGKALGRIRAKTGTLSGVVGLAGFAFRPDGEIISFAMFFNGGASQIAPARNLFDKMATTLMD